MPLPKLLITAAMTAANMALTMLQKIEGPRLDDTKFAGGDYGAPIPMVWGMRRIAPPCFWGEDLREVKRESKTKGGKYNSYTYYGTWAVAVCDGPIEAVRRIWLDKHLALDLSGAGPVTPFDFTSESGGGKSGGGAGAGGFSLNDHIAIYYGSETQEADPRVEASTEARNGVGSCPAYRGVSYIVFKDIPLEKLGNRIPQVEVEVVTASTGSIPSENYTASPVPGYNKWRLSPDSARMAWISGSSYTIWDVAARAEMISGTLPYDTVGSGMMGVFNDGRMLYADLFGGDLYTMSPEGENVLMYNANAASNGQSGGWVVADGNGVEHWGGYPSSFFTESVFDGTMIDFGWQVNHAFADVDGNVWVCGNYGTTLYFRRMTTLATDLPTAFSVAMPDDPGGEVYAVGGTTNFLTFWGGDFYLVDPLTGTKTAAATVPGASLPGVASAFANVRTGATSIWLVNREYSIDTGQLLRTASLPADPGIRRAVYDPINHALWTTDNNLTIFFLDRVSNASTTLGDIAADLADRCGIENADYILLDQVVQGWSATQGQASNMLEPLFDAFDCDQRPHDFSLQGVKRTGTTGGTILTERFVQNDPPYNITRKQAAELPLAITVNFADVDADQQPNNIRSMRPLDATGARGEQSLDLTSLASDPDEMRGLADRFFRRKWNENRQVSNGLTMQEAKLEPGDCRTLYLDDEQAVYRLTQITFKADDTLSCEWVYDHADLAILDATGGAGFDGRDPDVIAVPLLSKGFVLDLPLLTDSDSSTNPILYTAASPYASGSWPGAVIYGLIGTEYTDEFASVSSSAAATWGYATDVLPDALASVWDRVSEVNVMLQVGTLTGCTEADIDANASRNLCLIGDELLNFTTATLEGDGSYTLSGFRRGRRGTEWATSGHAARDVFLLLSNASATEEGLSTVGTDLSFKAVTSGRTASGAFPIDLTFTGASLKPYSPVNLTATQSGSDWVLAWTRRTRVGGDWTSGTTIPLSEASESYKVRIYNGATLVRTITATGATATYASADQTTDFGAPLSSAPTWTVVQVSDAVGDGFVAAY